MTEGSRRAVIAAFLANLGIAVAKFVAFLATGAASMLAESVHSVADASNQGLLVLGTARARRDPTPEHPFGFGTERYFWAFVVALVLFSLGALFAIYEGVEKLRHPHGIDAPGWALGVLTLGIGLESWSFRTAVREARPLLRGRGWWEFVRHAKAPELPVVLLEDLGALTGLVLAFAGVGLAWWLEAPHFDALGSISIGVLLAVIAAVLAVEMQSLIVGEAASPHDRDAIRRTVEETPGVRRMLHLRTLHLGPEDLLVAVKAEFEGDLDVAGVASVVNAIERRVRAEIPAARIIYVEPDLHRAARRERAARGDGAGGAHAG